MLDVLSNNLANVNTTGFKSDRAVFSLKSPEGAAGLDPDSAEARLSAAWNSLDGEATNFEQGSLMSSGSATHVALQGEGFFQVQGDGGEVLLTRDGSFALDTESYLATGAGQRVLDDGGKAIKITAGGELTVEEAGAVKVDGAKIGQLGVVDVADRSLLSKAGGNVWSLAEGQEVLEAEGAVVRQYHLEGSNVEPVRALTELIAISRYYEAFQKSLEASTELDQQLNTTVGRIDR